jgi:hypothetical protein
MQKQPQHTGMLQMSRRMWIATFVTLLLVACGPTTAEEPSVSSQTRVVTLEPPTATLPPEPAATSTPEPTNTPEPTEVVEQVEPHVLTAEELEALNVGRHEWTSGAVGIDQFGNTITIVTDIEDYHLDSVPADEFKAELARIGIILDDSRSYRIEYRDLDEYEGDVPADAGKHVDYVGVGADPDIATGSIRQDEDLTVITYYMSPRYLALTMDNWNKDDVGYDIYFAAAVNLFPLLPENRHLGNAYIPEIYSAIDDALGDPEAGTYYRPAAIRAHWTGPYVDLEN